MDCKDEGNYGDRFRVANVKINREDRSDHVDILSLFMLQLEYPASFSWEILSQVMIMTITFRAPILGDLDKIMEIEQSGFSPEEAAAREAMKERIEQIPDSFIVAVTDKNSPVGYVVGPVIPERYLYDELFEKTIPNPQNGGYQSILSLVVDPLYQKQGIANQLLTELAKISKEHKREGVTLTCLESLIPFYEKNGYKAEGLSDSQHAGEKWYNMVLEL